MTEKKYTETRDEPGDVTCPACGNEQADMGKNVRCEACDFFPMPYLPPDGDEVVYP